MKSVSFSTKDLNDGTIVTSNVNFEDSSRNITLQDFSLRDGGKVLGEQFKAKTIILNGYISGTSAQDLEERCDDLKKELQNSAEGDLLITYRDGTRRFICTCQSILFQRNPYTIDKMDWQITFICSNPPYGRDLTQTTIDETSKVYSTTTIVTKSYNGSLVFEGSRAPFTNIVITVNSATSLSSISMKITNANGFSTTTNITSDFSAGDIIQIDKETGQVLKNGQQIDFSGGFPKYTLASNSYVFTVIGRSYDIDIKFKYYKLWL